MLTELKDVQQVQGEPFRRWFRDDAMDLIVWYSPDRKISGFQLCYLAGGHEHALTWLEDRGFSHDRVDDGEGRPARHKMTPILVSNGGIDGCDVVDRFRGESAGLDPEVAVPVLAKLKAYATCRSAVEI